MKKVIVCMALMTLSMSVIAQTKTVRIESPIAQPQQDSVAQAISATSTPTATKSTLKQTVHTVSSANPMEKKYGRPVADDHIRYDLLVKN